MPSSMALALGQWLVYSGVSSFGQANPGDHLHPWIQPLWSNQRNPQGRWLGGAIWTPELVWGIIYSRDSSRLMVKTMVSAQSDPTSFQPIHVLRVDFGLSPPPSQPVLAGHPWPWSWGRSFAMLCSDAQIAWGKYIQIVLKVSYLYSTLYYWVSKVYIYLG